MPVRKARAAWQGDLPNGKGKVELESENTAKNYNFNTRFENGEGSNPEERWRSR